MEHWDILTALQTMRFIKEANVKSGNVVSLFITQQEYYDKGDYVIREGEEGNTFFIIAKGKVRCNKTNL